MLQKQLEFVFGPQEENPNLAIYFRTIQDRISEPRVYRSRAIYKDIKFETITQLVSKGVRRNAETNQLETIVNEDGKELINYLASANHPDNKKNAVGVFFNIQSGGTKQSDITDVNVFSFDFDFKPKNPKKLSVVPEEVQKEWDVYQSNPTEYIEEKKHGFLKDNDGVLENFMIIETANGFHLYLKNSGDKNIEQEEYSRFLRSLAKIFKESWQNSIDTSVFDKGRVLRLAGFYHLKNEPFLVSLKQLPEDKTGKSMEGWLKHFNVELIDKSELKTKRELIQETKVDDDTGEMYVEEKRKVTKKKAQTDLKVTENIDDEEREYIAREYFGHEAYSHYYNILVGKEKPELSKPEVLEMIGMIHPVHFFDNDELLSTNFNCHFHHDEKPSAFISYFEKMNQYYYNCHSNCQSKTTMKLIAEASNLKFKQTIRLVCKLLGIKLVRSEFENNMNEKYSENLSFIYEVPHRIEAGEFSESLQKYFSGTRNRIANTRLRVYGTLNSIGKKQFYEHFNYDGHNYFFVSFSHLAEVSGNFVAKKNKKGLSKAFKYQIYEEVLMLQILGFIKRVPFSKIHPKIAEKSLLYKEQIEKQNDGSHEEKLINYYYIPDFEDGLMEAEKRAQYLDSKGFQRSKHLNKTSIISFLGNEIAEEIFPEDGRQIPHKIKEIGDQVINRIKEEFERQKQDYIMLDSIDFRGIKVHIYDEEIKKKRKKQASKTEIEKVLKSGYIESFGGFKKLKTNQETRKKYGIPKTVKGQFYIQED